MTTPDPAALREALTVVGSSQSMNLNQGRKGQIIAAAARWALDLIEGGKEIWWCVNHDASQSLTDSICLGYGGPRDCSMVKRLLVEP